MEAAGKAKLGKGEASVRQKEHNRAAKHVRDGLMEKKKERQQKELEEVRHSSICAFRCRANYRNSVGETVRELPSRFKGAVRSIRIELARPEARTRSENGCGLVQGWRPQAQQTGRQRRPGQQSRSRSRREQRERLAPARWKTVTYFTVLSYMFRGSHVVVSYRTYDGMRTYSSDT